jgi:hypothetical protein
MVPASLSTRMAFAPSFKYKPGSQLEQFVCKKFPRLSIGVFIDIELGKYILSGGAHLILIVLQWFSVLVNFDLLEVAR